MAIVRIAVASTALTATLDEAVPAAVAAIEEAGSQRAAIVCLPETGLPGHRGQKRPVVDVTSSALEDAVRTVADAAKRVGIVAIVGMEFRAAGGRRALENTVYVASSNTAGSDQGSASCVVAPDGKLVARLDYGVIGVIAADIELDAATANLARRWAPARNVI